VQALDGMGGKSIFVLEQGDKNRNVVFESLTGYGTVRDRAALPAEIVTAGDCRVILVDGEPVPSPFSAYRRPTTIAQSRRRRAADSRPLNDRDAGCARR